VIVCTISQLLCHLEFLQHSSTPQNARPEACASYEYAVGDIKDRGAEPWHSQMDQAGSVAASTFSCQLGGETLREGGDEQY